MGAMPHDPSFLGEFWLFLKERKAWWLTPIVLLLLLVGALIVFSQVAGPLSPFVYPI